MRTYFYSSYEYNYKWNCVALISSPLTLVRLWQVSVQPTYGNSIIPVNPTAIDYEYSNRFVFFLVLTSDRKMYVYKLYSKTHRINLPAFKITSHFKLMKGGVDASLTLVWYGCILFTPVCAKKYLRTSLNQVLEHIIIYFLVMEHNHMNIFLFLLCS